MCFSPQRGTLVGRKLLRLAITYAVLGVLGNKVTAQASLPPGYEVRIAEAVQALKSGDLDSAENTFSDALRHGVRHPIIYHNLGIISALRGNHPEAITRFRQSLALQPNFGSSRLLLGSSLLALRKNTEAITELKRAARILPREPRVHLELGKGYEALGNWIAAVQEFQRSVQLAPEEPEYSYQLCNAWTKLSESSFRQIMTLKPNSARLSQGLGLEYAAEGRYDQALAAYREAALLDPKLPEIHLAMAKILFQMKRLDEALSEIQTELELVPESKDARVTKEKIEAAKIGALP
jgi:tetratricopeptide (TPR) repeat protein